MISESPGSIPTTAADECDDIRVRFENIRYSVGQRRILSGLTGTVDPRRCLAIMGSTGAGKTTFLNALGGRLAQDETLEYDPSGEEGNSDIDDGFASHNAGGPLAICSHCKLDSSRKLGGQVFLNGVPYERKMRRLFGFVPQDDVLLTGATPLEALTFSLRVRRTSSSDEASRRVAATLDELSLTEVQNTQAGDPGLSKGLSGGERKRTNIGIELVTHPSMLLLDEPTSGLDSVTSAQVCALLQSISRGGRTVAYTIHQPTSECAQHFDDLMLLVGGRVAYHGPMSESRKYFESIGFRTPAHHTPTDHFMTIMQDGEIGPRLPHIWAERQANCQHSDTHDEVLCDRNLLIRRSEGCQGSTAVQFTELLKRSVLTVFRNKAFLITSVAQVLIFGAMLALIFSDLKETQTGVADRHGLFFTITLNGVFGGVLSMINSFPPHRAVFIREQQSGSYSPLLFFAAYLLAYLPMQIPNITLLCIIVYFPTTLVLAVNNFFVFLLVMFTVQQVGVGIGFTISVSIDNFSLASGFAPLIVVPMSLAGGLIASLDRLRWAWVWLEKISVVRHGFVLLEQNEFSNIRHLSCNAEKLGASYCARSFQTGEDVLEFSEFDDGTHHAPWLMWCSLAIMLIVTRLIGLVSLYRISRQLN